MEMLCPDCLGPLERVNADTVRCTLHGGKYRLLFARPSGPVAVALLPTVGAEAAMNVVPSAPDRAAHSSNPFAPSVERLGSGQACLRHATIAAVTRCQRCQAALCATCDFAFPGNVHLCAECVQKPQPAVSSKRRKYVVWSLILAAWCTIGLSMLFLLPLLGHTEFAEDEGLATVLGTLILLPSLIGTGLGVGALDRTLGNPPLVWIAAVWNGVLLFIYVILAIVGSFMR